MPETTVNNADEVTAPSAEQLEIAELRRMLDLYRHAWRTVHLAAGQNALATIKCWAPRQHDALVRDLAANP